MSTWRQQRPWPHRVGRAALVWAVAYAGFGLACVLSGTPLLHFGGDAEGLAWAVVAVGGLAAPVSGAVVRYGMRPALRVLLLSVSVLTGVMAFSLLMDVITLMAGQRVDSWASTANKALAAVGAVLLAATARSDRLTAVPTDTTAPQPSAAPRSVQLTTWAGTLAFLPYAAMKTHWASGGTFAGVTGEEMLAVSERNGVVGTGYLALVTAGAVTMGRGDFPSEGDALLVGWTGITAFAVYGVALAVAARSYWLRTRTVRLPVAGGSTPGSAAGPAATPGGGTSGGSLCRTVDQLPPRPG